MMVSDLYPELPELGKLVASSISPDDNPRVWHYRAKDGRVVPLRVLVRRVQWRGRNAALVVVASDREGHRRRDITDALEVAGSGG